MTLLFVNSLYKSALIQYGIQDGCQEEIFYCVFFSYINISDIFMSEICLNCNECLFLIYTDGL